MTKITCADITCKYCKDGKCTSKHIKLNHECVATVNQGRREFNTCLTKIESAEYTEMKGKILEAMLKDDKRSS